MYDGIKRAFGPSATQTAPLKYIITDRSKLMKRWTEHYQEPYSTENIVTDIVVESTSLLPFMNKFDLPPSVVLLRKAISSLA